VQLTLARIIRLVSAASVSWVFIWLFAFLLHADVTMPSFRCDVCSVIHAF